MSYEMRDVHTQFCPEHILSNSEIFWFLKKNFVLRMHWLNLSQLQDVIILHEVYSYVEICWRFYVSVYFYVRCISVISACRQVEF